MKNFICSGSNIEDNDNIIIYADKLAFLFNEVNKVYFICYHMHPFSCKCAHGECWINIYYANYHTLNQKCMGRNGHEE